MYFDKEIVILLNINFIECLLLLVAHEHTLFCNLRYGYNAIKLEKMVHEQLLSQLCLRQVIQL